MGVIGGAPKRYVALFNYLRESHPEYYLIINKPLFDTFHENGLLENSDRILILPLGKKTVYSTGKKSSGGKTNPMKVKPKIKIAGKIKYFLKLFLQWTKFARQYSKLQKKYKFSLIYSVYTGGMWVWPLKFLHGFKLIYSFNDASCGEVSKKFPDFFVSEYWPSKYADKVDFLSADIVKKLAEKGLSLPESRVGVTTNSFIFYDKFYAERPKENTVVFLARLEKGKNAGMLLKAAKILQDKNELPGIKIFILGDGPERPALLEYAEENALKNVELPGVVYTPWEYLRKSRVFISVQDDNNYPSQSLLEAMACENAIIATDVGETRMLVEEDNGILIGYSEQELADALVELFNNPEKMDKMGALSRKKATENHTIEKFAEYFFSITRI